MSENLTKEYFDLSIRGIFDRFNAVDAKMEDLQSEVKKIEAQGNVRHERLIRLETKHESLQAEMNEHKVIADKEFHDVFEKIRSCRKESDKGLTEKVEAANNRQNLKLISQSVLYTSVLLGIVTTILKLAGVL